MKLSLSKTFSGSSPTRIALLVAGAFFMENLDGTVIATALPRMAASFGTSAVDLHIGMTAYLLTLAIFIPISGWIADRYGPRGVFTTAIALFTFASVLCGFATGLVSFTAARCLQGFGGAMMVPVGRLVVLRTTEKRDLMRSIAYITWPGLAAPLIGPPLGGLITEYFSWNWIFFLNLPLGLIGLALAFRLIPQTAPPERPRFDFTGFALTGLACAGLLYGLDLAGRGGAPVIFVGFVLIVAFVCGGLAIGHMRHARHPLFDLSVFKIKTFAVTLYGGSLFRMAISAVPFLLPLLFQVGFGLDPLSSGLLVLAVFAGNIAMKLVTTQIISRFGFRTVLIVNGVLAAASLGGCALLTKQTPIFLTLPLLFVGGLTRSMQFSALSSIGFADVPAAQMSSANSISSTATQLNSGFGIALGALVLQISAVLAGRHDVALADFRIAFVTLGIIALIGTLDCFALAPDAGSEVSRRKSAATRA